MACFLVTTAAAIGVGAARHIKKHNEKRTPEVNFDEKFINSKKLGYLELTLWGGALLLAGEHAFHGEITYKFPWLTAATEGKEEVLTMLKEMGTVGVGMLLILVGAWFAGLFIARWLANRKKKPAVEEK